MDNIGNKRNNYQRGRGGWERGWRGRGRGQFSRNNYRGTTSTANRGRGRASGPTFYDVLPATSQRTLDGIISQNPACPYKGWHLYLPDEKYREGSSILRKVEIFEKHFVSWKSLYRREMIEEQGSFMVDVKELENDPAIKEAWPSFYNDVKDNPEQILACLGLAMHQILTHDLEQEMTALNDEALQDEDDVHIPQVLPAASNLPAFHARLVGFEPVTPLKTLKATFYGKFLSVKGTVIRVSNIKPLCIRMAFKCSTCEETQTTSLPDGKYAMPTKCSSRECRGRSFTPDRSSSLTETIDWQTIKIQELTTDDQEESGRIPRTVECELTNDLVDSCVPGDIVTVTGVVKVSSSQEAGGFKQNKEKCLFVLYIHANSVSNCKGQKSRNGSEDVSVGVGLEFSVKDLYAVQEIQAENNLFRLLVSSLCPAIYGHEMVKAGLVLGLFGGTHKFANDHNRIPIRGDPHVLVVGDPGLGKSQMLQACANIAPRGVFVCGNTTTTSGLTVTVCKESSSADYALEAGALVLADQGCCCIDEFDKMSNQHQALLEAMEQQSISIAKAGIICSLPARASILAAANPVGGHYNKAKTVSENLKMGSALLSRFDLVFILVDKPDEELDNMLSKHVMAMHAGQKQGLYSLTPKKPSQSTPTQSQHWEDLSLGEKLKFRRNDAVDPIPHQVLRKYIGYARKYVHPKLSIEAAKVLQQFYLELRRSSRSGEGTPITTRQLESLIRLSEARARLELRETATEQDAKDVVEIMKYSMIDTYSNELGFLDVKRSHHGSGMSSRSQPKKFVAALDRIAEQTSNSLFTVQQMKQLVKELNIPVRNFDDFLESLNNQNYLLKKGPRVYQLLTSGF